MNTTDPDTVSHLPQQFPIVGIGCSAGGLEALEKFLAHVPDNSGMAFVIIQHMAPEHVSFLPEILQNLTQLPVCEAQEAMIVRPNCVYVIPPNKYMALQQRKLHLSESIGTRGTRTPIDFFLRSLAVECKDKAVGVILSGMGTDGNLGLRAIREVAGVTVVQLPSSAGEQGMPLSAIEAGLADIVSTPETMPDSLMRRITDPLHDLTGAKAEHADSSNALRKIIELLREHTGSDFSQYKTSTVSRRIERRMAVNQIPQIDAYLLHLREHPQEVDILFKELLIGVTAFFRDRHVWDTIQYEVLPQLLARYPEGYTFRAWVPACSRGDEAYTLAIVFREAVMRHKPAMGYSLQIFATDLDADAIEVARKGSYPESIATEIPQELMARYFAPHRDGGYVIRKDIREMVVYARQNIISDPPFTRLDIVCCRNLLIYFNATLQSKLIPLFHYALNQHGVLVLGTAETVGNFSELFTPIGKAAHIFRKQATVRQYEGLEFPGKKLPALLSERFQTLAKKSDNIGDLVDSIVQQNWAPAAVLVNDDGDILYISGRTGKYLEPAAGLVNMNIHAMAREGLREALIGAIQRARRERQPVQLKGLRIGASGEAHTVDVFLQTFEAPEILQRRILVVFKDVPISRTRERSRQNASEDSEKDDLVQALQMTREALRTSQEEMQSTVEELKSSNEELQSTNEELTTSKEELQSLNEELLTVNAELESKVNDLTWVRNDMANLLNSTEIATLFLDDEMKVRRFTNFAARIFRLIPSDIGRVLTDIVTDLDYPELSADATEVLGTLVFKEKLVKTKDGRSYRVRIMPYRTLDNVIDGVVITFVDATYNKSADT